VRPILFLCGIKFAATYASAYFAKNPKAEHLGPSHPLDDGAERACCAALKTLVKLARSREIRSQLRHLRFDADRAEWIKLYFAFVRLSGRGLPARAAEWIRKGDPSANWIRLSFGMGAITHYQIYEFTGALLKNRFSFVDCDGCDVTTQVTAVVTRFAWSPQWVLSEI
jgi:hypothetical protein